MTEERESYTYALLTTLKEEGRDFIDVFCPFVLNAIAPGQLVDIEEIRANFTKNFGLKVGIPKPALKTILKRAKREGYIELGKKIGEDEIQDKYHAQKSVTLYKLQSKGLSYAQRIDNTEEIEKKINALYKNISLYFLNKKEVRLTRKEVHDMLSSFIRKNLNALGQFIHKNESVLDHVFEISRANEKYLLDYIKFISDKNDEDYVTLREMLYGSVISTVLYDEKADLSEIGTKKLRPCKVYLDTNFLFSVLGMHSPEESKSARELFDLLRRERFDVRVFDFTVYEMRRVMAGYELYLQRKERVPFAGTSLGLYGALEDKDWTQEKSRKFINNTGSILADAGLIVERIPTETLSDYQAASKDIEYLLEQKKPLQSRRSREHDLMAILIIRKRRGKKVWKIEDSKAFFLTSDRVLSDMNFIDMGHKKDHTICEVFLDRILVNVLWLKDPKLQFPLITIIAANARDLFINHNVWEAFYKKLRELYVEEKISEDDIFTLFYDNYVEYILTKISEEQIDKVTEDIILESIKKAHEHFKQREKKRKEITERRLNKLKGELDGFIEILNEKDIESELLKLKALSVFEENRRELVEKFTREQAKSYVLSVFIFLNIIFFAVSIALILLGQTMVSVGMLILLGILDVLKLSNTWLWGKIKEKRYNWLLAKNMGIYAFEKSGLDIIEEQSEDIE
jgi:hypothetical protein